MRRTIVALLVIFFFTTPISFADSGGLPDPGAFLASQGNSNWVIGKIDESEAGKALSGILSLIYQLGYGIAIIVLFILCIQLMITPAQKKAEAKSALVPYILGLLLLVAGVPIATIIIEAFTKVF